LISFKGIFALLSLSGGSIARGNGGKMKRQIKWMIVGCCVMLLATGSALAAVTKQYQVTGPVVAITDNMIVISKGMEQWEIAKDPATKITGSPKVGSRVTVQYTMAAAAVEVKPGKAAKSETTKK
jgi:hypothetical protein